MCVILRDTLCRIFDTLSIYIFMSGGGMVIYHIHYHIVYRIDSTVCTTDSPLNRINNGFVALFISVRKIVILRTDSVFMQ